MRHLPNLITLSRIPMLFFIVGLMYLPWRGSMMVAFILFLVAAISDWVDGFLARRTNTISKFGTLMDALSDKVFTLGLFIAMLKWLPTWAMPCVLLMLTREFLVTGLRLVAVAQGKVLPAQKFGKIKTILQCIVLGCFLFYWALVHDLAWNIPNDLAGHFFSLSLLLFVAATAITVASGVNYIVKHWELLMSGS